MEVLMAVYVRPGKARLRKSRELFGDLCVNLTPRRGSEERPHTSRRGMVRKPTGGIDERGYLRSRQRSAPIAQHEMEADTEGGILACKLNGSRGAGLVYHEAGARQDAFAVSTNHGGIRYRIGAEV